MVRIRPVLVLVSVLSLTAPVARAQVSRRTKAVEPPAISPAHKRTVVVDAGHGGVDRGMTGVTPSQSRIYEKDITLQVARRVSSRLEASGVSVIMTRP